MGNLPCRDEKKYVDRDDVPADDNYDRPAPVFGDGEVRMIIVALDYLNSRRPLTATQDGRQMEELARVSQVQDLTVLYNRQATRQTVSDAIKRVGGACGPDDYFVFYFAGHGTSVRDVDGDEADGYDEALVLQDKNGRKELLVDDEFAHILRRSIDKRVRVLIICDCCHSGTIGDFERHRLWRGVEAISITGCMDDQVAEDTGKGGIFTHALLFAIARLQEQGEEEYSLGRVFNKAVKEDRRIFGSEQTLVLDSTMAAEPDQMAWPLLPQWKYKAPLSRTSTALRYGNLDIRE